METEFGEFKLLAYEDHVHREVHLALVRGDIDAAHARRWCACIRSIRCRTSWACAAWAAPGRCATRCNASPRSAPGIVIVLRDHTHAARTGGRGERARYSAPDTAASAQVAPQVLRTYGIGAQILKDLGVTRMQVLSTPKQLQGLSAFGLEITGYVAE